MDSTFHHSLKRTVPPFSPERNDEKGFSSLPTIPQYWKFVRIFYKKQTSLPLVRNYGLEGRNDNPLSFLQSTLKLDESQTLNLRKLSYVGGLTSKGQVGVLLGEHRGMDVAHSFFI